MSWIKKISRNVMDIFNVAKTPLLPLPPHLLMGEVRLRSGLSAISLTSAVLSRLSEAGIKTEVNADGSPNKTNLLVKILCEEIIKEIKENGLVTTIIEPNTIFGEGKGGSAVGPVQTATRNTNLTSTKGIIQ